MNRPIIRTVGFLMRLLTSILLVMYSFTLGIITKKGRKLLTIVCDYYNLNFLTNTISTKLPVILHRELIENHTIILMEPKCREGNVSLNELAVINGIILNNNPLRIFEIGTFDGRTTINMAANSSNECVIFTLDLEQRDVLETKFQLGEGDKFLATNRGISGQRFINLNKSDYTVKDKIVQLYGDSATFNFKPYYNTIDLVFVDAAHSYDYVIHDTNIAFQLLKNGKGIILWHDYKIYPDVVKAIDTISSERRDLNIFNIKHTTLAYVKIN